MKETNNKIILKSSGFALICPANHIRTKLIISNDNVAGKDAWLFFGDLESAVLGYGYYLSTEGEPYKTNRKEPYTGPVCGIALGPDVEVGIVES